MESPRILPPIRKSVVLNAPIEKVWEAVATSEGIKAWWMDNTFEPVLGREFILRAGPYGDSPCKVTEIDPPHRLSFTWAKDWHVTFELNKLEETKTGFTLVHDGWDAAQVTDFVQPHTKIRSVMENGWEGIVKESLVRHVEG